MIEVKNLVRTFKSGDRTIKPVNDVSFELEQGTLASIVAHSVRKPEMQSSLAGVTRPRTSPSASGSSEMRGRMLLRCRSRAPSVPMFSGWITGWT